MQIIVSNILTYFCCSYHGEISEEFLYGNLGTCVICPAQTSWWQKSPALQYKRVPVQWGNVLPGYSHNQSRLHRDLWQQDNTGRVLQWAPTPREMLCGAPYCSHFPQVRNALVLFLWLRCLRELCLRCGLSEQVWILWDLQAGRWVHRPPRS